MLNAHMYITDKTGSMSADKLILNIHIVEHFSFSSDLSRFSTVNITSFPFPGKDFLFQGEKTECLLGGVCWDI